jgi:hypothetical protein
VKEKFLVVVKEFFWVGKSLGLGEVPWSCCSPRKIRGRLQRSWKDLSSRFFFFGLQSLPLKCGRPLLCYLRNFFYREKSGFELPSEKLLSRKAAVDFL